MTKIDRAHLKALSDSASKILAEIQAITGRNNVTEARIRFPRGYIRSTTQTRARLPITYGTFDETKIRNICYSLQMADLLRWLAIRTDLTGMLLSQMVKEYICIYGHASDYILDASCIELGALSKTKSKPYKKRSSLLVAEKHIQPNTKKEIDWLWDVRCREHPDRLDDLETTTYGRADADRARKAFENFCEEIQHSILIRDFEVIED